MPSHTPKQKRTMAAAAHDPGFADKMGIPQSVAREFNRADQAKSSGGGLKRGFYAKNYCAGGKVISSSRG